MTRVAAGVLGLGKAGGSLVASLLGAGMPVDATATRSGTRRAAFRERYPDIRAPAARVTTLLQRLAAAGTDVLFLAVPDDALQDVARTLAKADALPPVVAHLSGSRGPEALAALQDRTTPAAFHPLAALDGETPIPRGTLLAISATRAPARKRLARVAAAIGAEPATVAPGEHARYHLGAVTAANLAVGLLDDGVDHLVRAGVPPGLARTALARLLRSTADACERHPLDRALTGPVARGDASTIARHLEVLANGDDETGARYRDLSRRLLDVARLSAAQKKKLRALLDE